MIMGVDIIEGLRCHGLFYTGFISKCHQQLLSKGIVGLCIPRILMLRIIWGEVLLKFSVSFCELLSRKKVLTESGYLIETNIDEFVEIIEVQISFSF